MPKEQKKCKVEGCDRLTQKAWSYKGLKYYDTICAFHRRYNVRHVSDWYKVIELARSELEKVFDSRDCRTKPYF